MLVNVHTKVPGHSRWLEDAVTDGQGKICYIVLIMKKFYMRL